MKMEKFISFFSSCVGGVGNIIIISGIIKKRNKKKSEIKIGKRWNKGERNHAQRENNFFSFLPFFILLCNAHTINTGSRSLCVL